MEAPSTASAPVPPIEERRSPSFFAQHKFTLISIAILVVALIPLLLLTQMHKNQPAKPQEVTAATPTQGMTQDNAQPTIDAADQNIQQTLNQADSELNSVNQINSSSDSTAGL